MERDEYRLMYELEERHWWYAGLHELLLSTIREISGNVRTLKILDAGCGTGFMLKGLERFGNAFGIDISETALEYCRRRGLRRVARSSVTALPFADESYDVVLSADVLYHRDVGDDRRALSEIHRVLKKGGVLVMHVPAYEHLRRGHDERVHTRHRYTSGELSEKIRRNGFDLVKMNYRNSFLFLPFFILSLLERSRHAAHSDLTHVAGPLNAFLLKLIRIENCLVKKVNMPFGSSLFCIAKK